MEELKVVGIIVSMVLGLWGFVRTMGRDQNKLDSDQNTEITKLRENQKSIEGRLSRLEDWQKDHDGKIWDRFEELKSAIHDLEIKIVKAIGGD